MNNYKVLPQNKPSECTDQEIAFCELILNTMNTRSGYVFAAGYFDGEDHDDPVVKRKASDKYKSLMDKKCVKMYLAKNRKSVYVTDDCDVPALKRRLYEMAMGRATQEVLVKTKEGVQKEIVSISIQDQITAANSFFKFNEADRKYKLSGVKTVTDRQSKEQEKKVLDFISRYRTVDIKKSDVLDKHPEIIDVDFEETEDERDSDGESS